MHTMTGVIDTRGTTVLVRYDTLEYRFKEEISGMSYDDFIVKVKHEFKIKSDIVVQRATITPDESEAQPRVVAWAPFLEDDWDLRVGEAVQKNKDGERFTVLVRVGTK